MPVVGSLNIHMEAVDPDRTCDVYPVYSASLSLKYHKENVKKTTCLLISEHNVFTYLLPGCIENWVLN